MVLLEMTLKIVLTDYYFCEMSLRTVLSNVEREQKMDGERTFFFPITTIMAASLLVEIFLDNDDCLCLFLVLPVND